MEPDERGRSKSWRLEMTGVCSAKSHSTSSTLSVWRKREGGRGERERGRERERERESERARASERAVVHESGELF